MNYLQMIQSIVPAVQTSDFASSFNTLGIDSFDLLTIRVEYERSLGRDIPDRTWVEFRTFADLNAYCDSLTTASSTNPLTGAAAAGVGRTIELNMPQMAIGSLSENWLFKEFGSTHWHLLCQGLARASNALHDELGNRLYATFARVQTSGAALDRFEENELLRLEGDIYRYGSGMYFSEMSLISMEHAQTAVSVKMITSFSRRSGLGNKDLVKSHPNSETNTIENLAQVPDFINEYRLIKKGELHLIELDGHKFQVTEETLFSFDYELNPYYDLNGASLLYFASYPTINDYCEAKRFNTDVERWEQNFFTTARDIMYYANCDINDGIRYELNGYEEEGDRRFMISTLYRKSDGQLMARIFTVKTRNRNSSK